MTFPRLCDECAKRYKGYKDTLFGVVSNRPLFCKTCEKAYWEDAKKWLIEEK